MDSVITLVPLDAGGIGSLSGILTTMDRVCRCESRGPILHSTLSQVGWKQIGLSSFSSAPRICAANDTELKLPRLLHD